MKKILSGGAAWWLLLTTLWNPKGAFAPRAVEKNYRQKDAFVRTTRQPMEELKALGNAVVKMEKSMRRMEDLLREHRDVLEVYDKWNTPSWRETAMKYVKSFGVLFQKWLMGSVAHKWKAVEKKLDALSELEGQILSLVEEFRNTVEPMQKKAGELRNEVDTAISMKKEAKDETRKKVDEDVEKLDKELRKQLKIYKAKATVVLESVTGLMQRMGTTTESAEKCFEKASEVTPAVDPVQLLESTPKNLIIASLAAIVVGIVVWLEVKYAMFTPSYSFD